MTPAEYIQRAHKLPKWARDYIQQLHDELALKVSKDKAHAILMSTGNWFTLVTQADDKFTLFRLYKDSAHALCEIGNGDIVLVGRKKEKTMTKEGMVTVVTCKSVREWLDQSRAHVCSRKLLFPCEETGFVGHGCLCGTKFMLSLEDYKRTLYDLHESVWTTVEALMKTKAGRIELAETCDLKTAGG